MKPLALCLLAALAAGACLAAPSNLSIIIANGAAYSGSTTVTLYLHAENATNCTYSDQGGSYGAYEPYAATKAWVLPTGDGAKSVLFKCVDDNGTESAAVSDGIMLDTEVPSAQPSLPPPNGWAVSARPLIRASLADAGSGINGSAVRIRVDGQEYNATWEASTGYAGYTPASDLNASANHSVEAVAYDNYGRQASASWSFSIDAVPPALTVPGPTNATVLRDATPKISVLAKDNESGINSSRFSFAIDGASIAASASYDAATGNLSSSASTALADGDHTVSATAYDLAGNSVSLSWNFRVDRSAPAISGMYPVPDTTYTATVKGINATITDAVSGVDAATIDLRLDNSTMTGASFTPESGYLFMPLTMDLPSGVHGVEIMVSDKVGNSQYKYWAFTIDRKGPAITAFAPAEGAMLNSSQPGISATMQDAGTSGLNASSAKLMLDGYDRSSWCSFAGGAFACVPASPLQDGNHSAEVSVSNNDGQRASKSWSFATDTVAPQPPQDFSAVADGANVRMSWPASPSTDTVSYLVYRSAGATPPATITLLATASAPALNHSLAASGKKEYFAVSAKDAAGNEGTKVFRGTCGKFMSGLWYDYQCCGDADCASGNSCDNSTHTCVPEAGAPQQNQTAPPAAPANATEGQALAAINSTRAAMESARAQGKNVSAAENVLQQAQNAYNVGNYEQAKYLAEYSMTKVQGAQSLPASAPPATSEAEKGCLGAMLLLALPFAIFVSRGIDDGNM